MKCVNHAPVALLPRKLSERELGGLLSNSTKTFRRFVVDKVALGQVFPRVLRFSLVSIIPPVLHYKEKLKKKLIFITGLHNKPKSCGASVASAAGSFTTHTQKDI
jgi:hypothetical protein